MTGDLDYGAEFVLQLGNGNTIRTDTYEDNHAGASYVRVCDPDGDEIAYWSCDEWAEEPQFVMGAFIGCAGNIPDPDEYESAGVHNARR